MFFGDSISTKDQILKDIVLYLSTLQTWIPGSAFTINVTSWSISVLLFFYFVFPFVLIRLHNLSNRQIVVYGTFLWIIYLIPAVIYMAYQPDGIVATVSSSLSDSPWLHVLKTHPILRLPEFIIGMMAGAIYRQGGFDFTNKWKHMLVFSLFTLILIAFLLPMNTPLYPLLHNGLLIPVNIIIVIALAYDESWLSKLGEKPFSRKLADSSLSLFVIHFPLWTISLSILRKFRLLDNNEPSFWLVIMGVVCLIAISLALDHIILRPISNRFGILISKTSYKNINRSKN